MKVFYTGPYPDDGKVSAFGTTFEEGKATDLDEKFAAKVEGNKFFSSEAKEAKKAAKERDDTGLKAEHHGGGRFNITKGETVVKQGLTKAQADDFNALDEKAKEDFVKALSA